MAAAFRAPGAPARALPPCPGGHRDCGTLGMSLPAALGSLSCCSELLLFDKGWSFLFCRAPPRAGAQGGMVTGFCISIETSGFEPEKLEKLEVIG